MILRRKGVRFIKRFLRRMLEIWYMGIFCLIVIGVLVLVSLEFHAYKDLQGYISGLINIMITVYAIDFLRTEYERRRGVNQRYLVDTDLAMLGSNGIQVMEIVLLGESPRWGEEKVMNLSEEEIRTIILTPDLLDLYGWDGKTRRETLNELRARLQPQLTDLSYTGFMTYQHYRIARNILNYNQNDSYIGEWANGSVTVDAGHSYVLGGAVIQLIKLFKEARSLHFYWWKDSDLETKIQELKRKKEALTHS